VALWFTHKPKSWKILLEVKYEIYVGRMEIQEGFSNMMIKARGSEVDFVDFVDLDCSWPLSLRLENSRIF
jgi:hypothetical protein